MVVSVGPDHAQMLSTAARFVENGALGKAEPICREVLGQDPLNVNAMCLLGDIGVRLGAFGDAEKLLRRCLELAPDFRQARGHLANALFKKQKYEAALEQLDLLEADDGDNPGTLLLRANIYSQTGRYEEGLTYFRRLAQIRPDSARIHMSLGHTLKTVGAQAQP